MFSSAFLVNSVAFSCIKAMKALKRKCIRRMQLRKKNFTSKLLMHSKNFNGEDSSKNVFSPSMVSKNRLK